MLKLKRKQKKNLILIFIKAIKERVVESQDLSYIERVSNYSEAYFFNIQGVPAYC